ncbi:MAG: hypothetical protein PHE96_06145 [Methylococcales bacterium]|nr:hypothetical protein [Methylococcales bacterium]
MNKKLLAITTLGLVVVLLPTQQASAHIAYKPIQGSESQVVNADGSITDNTLDASKGLFAWATAAQPEWGDSHATHWYKIDITNPEGAYIDLSVTASLFEEDSTVLDDLKPAFTIYQGLLPGAAHDAATPQAGKIGMWNALGDMTMGNGPGPVYDYDPITGEQILISNDPGTVATVNYVTHAGFVGSTASSASIENYFLQAGTYSLALGGTCFEECYPRFEKLDPASPYYDPNFTEEDFLALENDAETRRGYNIALTVHPVPVPAAAWLMGSGLLGLFGLRNRKKLHAC